MIKKVIANFGSIRNILFIILSASLIMSPFFNCWFVFEKQSLSTENAILKNRIIVKDAEINDTKATLIELMNENQRLSIIISENDKQAPIIRLKDPSYKELEKFLEEDEISEQRYGIPRRVCINFAKNLRESAHQAGLNFSFIVLNVRDKEDGTEWGHALNGCYLDDGTFVFIEPQTDKTYRSLSEFLEENDLELINYVIIW